MESNIIANNIIITMPFTATMSKITLDQGRHQVRQSGVDNMGWGVSRGVPSPVGGRVWGRAMQCPLPRKSGIFLLKWRLLAHFDRAGVEIALINSLQF